MSDISGDTGSEADVVEREVRDERVQLEEERERLTDTTCRSSSSQRRSGVGRSRVRVCSPAAPRTATRVFCLDDDENALLAKEAVRLAANML